MDPSTGLAIWTLVGLVALDVFLFYTLAFKAEEN